ncbi:MAG: hypothetical protein JST75_04430 [Bacteroidetes bacterium]|nr:hypothetical protein [Bacteroidota bacterium]
MKKILLFIAIMLVFVGAIVWAYNKSKQFRTEQYSLLSLPSFNLLLMDSSTLFSTNQLQKDRLTILIYFSPDCDHCQRLTKNLIKNINGLKSAQICLITPMPISETTSFYKSFDLGNYKNIVVTQDYKFSFYNFFKVSAFPYIAIYDGQKKLIKLYREEVNMERIFKAVHI